MKKSRIARPIAAVESPAVRSLPLVDLLVDTKAELFELMVRSGLRVLDAMLEEDRTALCGPRYAHQPARAASRTGRVPSDVVVGGRKVAVSRPRVRATRLQRSLATTNAAESLLSRTRYVKRNVKRWRGGQMMLRWVAAGVLEAVKGFRRLKGCGDMPRLVSALRARDQRLGLGVSEANVA